MEKQANEERNWLGVLHKRIVKWSEAREGYNGLDANGKSKADVQSLREDISLAVWCE
jgi:hypothetical protein